MVFEHAGEVLDGFFAAVFGHGRDGDADDFAVVHGVEALAGGADGLFDGADQGILPGLDEDELRLGGGDLGDLGDRGLGAVVVDLDLVEHVDGGAAGADAEQIGAEVFDGLVHARFEAFVHAFESYDVDHCRHSALISFTKSPLILQSLQRGERWDAESVTRFAQAVGVRGGSPKGVADMGSAA